MKTLSALPDPDANRCRVPFIVYTLWLDDVPEARRLLQRLSSGSPGA